jgi:hypothetical protein
MTLIRERLVASCAPVSSLIEDDVCIDIMDHSMCESPFLVVMDPLCGTAAGRTVLSLDVEGDDRMHGILSAHDLNIFQLRRF